MNEMNNGATYHRETKKRFELVLAVTKIDSFTNFVCNQLIGQILCVKIVRIAWARRTNKKCTQNGIGK